jgi:restriction system protein
MSNGPRFTAYFGPVLDALRALGGSARPDEVRAQVSAKLKLGDDVLTDLLPSGLPRFDNQIGWARFYLVKAGLIDASSRGIWSLTERGLARQRLTHEDAYELFRGVQDEFRGDREGGASPAADEAQPAPQQDDGGLAPAGYRVRLLELLRGLPAAGFERFCQRLLRESGFQEVSVTGRSGDGGIDGHGVLQVGPLVSFRVLFQCKRYQGLVSPSQMRDFRGAMQGRADKGIVLTTGGFTADARKEAVRDGAPPIELVDGDKLLLMIEQLRLGLTPVQSYEVDTAFFDQFKS